MTKATELQRALSPGICPQLMLDQAARFRNALVIQGSGAPAPLVDLALVKAIARGREWSEDLLAGRFESVAAIAKREQVLPH